MAVIKGKSYTVLFYVWNTADGTPKTGDATNITVRISKNGGPMSTTSNMPAELDSTYAPGWYRVTLSDSEMNADSILVVPQSTTPGVMCQQMLILTDKAHLPEVKTKTDKLQFVDDPPFAYVVAYTQYLAFGAVNSGTIADGAITAAKIADNAITASKIAADAIGASELASDAVQEIAAAILQNPANKLATDASGRVTAASVASDVNLNMSQSVPSSPSAGTTGDALRRGINNLNATVGSRAAPGDAMTLTNDERSSIATAVWSATTRTLTSFGSLANDVASAVWSASTRTLTSFGTLVSDIWSHGTRTLTSFGSLVSDVAQAVWNYAIDGTKTALKLMRLFASVLLGKVSGAQSNQPVFRDINDTKNRVTMQVDDYGNRTSVTLDDE